MVEKVFYMSINYLCKDSGGGDGKGQEDKRGEVEIMFNFDDVDQYITHWLRDNNAASLCIYYNYDMQNEPFLTRSQCRVSDIRVTVKARPVGLLIEYSKIYIAYVIFE